MSQWKCWIALLCLFCALPGWSQEVLEPAPPTQQKLNVSQEKVFQLPLGVQLNHKTVSPSDSRFFESNQGDFQAKTVIFTDGFDGSFPGSTWTPFSQGLSDVTWGKSNTRRPGSSVWWARTGTDAASNANNTPSNADSWMISPPLNLSSATSGDFSFDLWLETEQNFDFFFVAASLDGVNFTAFGTDENTNGWARFTLDLTTWGSLGDLTGNSQVWFSFIYVTDSSVTFEGPYVDEVLVDVNNTNSGGINLVINQVDTDDCPTVRVITSVTDLQGDPIVGLTEANFTLEEDGVTQIVTTETGSTGGNNLAVALVLDGSSSLSDADIDNVQTASNNFINLLAAGDQIAVYHFASDVDLVQNYTTNRNAARNAVNALNNSGVTSLYDAIFDAARNSTTVTGRRALVVMTDGRNNDSVRSLQEAIDEAVRVGVPVFTIGFGSANEAVLQQIASATGGSFFQGATSADLQTILNRIGQTLNNQYILTWRTATVDGQSHNVTVQVSTQGQTATQTASYNQAGTACANAVPCVEGPTTLCLLQDRFKVEVNWNDSNGNQGPGNVAACGSDDSGILWFFRPDNWEMLIKVLDGCGGNNHYWVFYSAATDVGYTTTVTDTLTGARRVYTNPLGTASPAVTDTSAFATCP